MTKKPNNPISLFVLSVFSVAVVSSAHATVNCAGYLPSSYFQHIESNKRLTGKLIEQTDGTQQLQNADGKVIIEGLTNAHIVMDKYVLGQRLDRSDNRHGANYGVVNTAGKTIVPFKYDDIQTQPDIATSFIVSVNTENGSVKQGIINRHGEWVYPLTDAHIQHAHYDSHYDQDYFIVTHSSEKLSDQRQTGLLDDRGYWAIMPQYDAIVPLNACTGQLLYMQINLQNESALIDQNNDIIIPFAPNQHIESFNNATSPLLFLHSRLRTGSTATGMSEDIQDEIISAQIIDASGKRLISSESPISKLLYHQLYTYKQAGKYGLLNDQGDVILKPQFDRYRDEGEQVRFEENGKLIPLERLLD
jgi:hypothetical protein